MGALKLEESTRSKFFALLSDLRKEHYRKRTNGFIDFYSAWVIDLENDVAILHLQSKKFSYVAVEVSPKGTYKIVFRLNPHLSITDLGLEITESLKGARKRLDDRKNNRKGGGRKKGFCMKHKCGPKALQRLNEAEKQNEISNDFKEALRRLDIGMSYTP